MTATLAPPATDVFEEAALVWAREFGYSGDRLPKGTAGSLHACPLAVATGLEVDSHEAYEIDRPLAGFCEYRTFPLPELVKGFVRRFDTKVFYPHLDADQPEES